MARKETPTLELAAQPYRPQTKLNAIAINQMDDERRTELHKHTVTIIH
jgi:hypothetical protein